MAQPMILKQLNKINGGLGQTGENFDTAAARTALEIGLGREGVLSAGWGSNINLIKDVSVQLLVTTSNLPAKNRGSNALILLPGVIYLITAEFSYKGGDPTTSCVRSHIYSANSGYIGATEKTFDPFKNASSLIVGILPVTKQDTITAWGNAIRIYSTVTGTAKITAYSLGTITTGA